MQNQDLKDTFKQIAAEKAYHQLEAFAYPEKWKEMSSDERELLALLFIFQGEHQLKDMPRNASLSFRLAEKVAPKNPRVYFRTALAFAAQEPNSFFLKGACKALSKATRMDPEFFDAWNLWANILLRWGITHSEIEYLQDAHDKFQKGETIINKTTQEKTAEFYSHWGFCCYMTGKISGEAVDFYKACEKYQKADEFGMEGPTFWTDYSSSLTALGCLISKQDLFFKAIELHWKTVRDSPGHAEGWVNLAFSFHALYDVKGMEAYFNLAQESFEEAVKLEEDNALLWLRWGLLLLTYAQPRRDEKLVLESIGKFENANLCEPNNAAILGGWGEALLLYGSITEDLQFLRLAEDKIKKSLAISSDYHSIWALHGTCLFELGRYFSDHKYYKEAVQKFQIAISLDHQDPRQWHGMAASYFAMGELLNDEELLEKASRLYGQVKERCKRPTPQFWNEWGICMMKLAEITGERNHVEAALHNFEQAIRFKHDDGEYKTDPEWIYNYGCALDYLGDFEENPIYYEKAVQALMTVLQNSPNHWQVHYNLALALTHLGEATAEIDFLYKAMEHFHTALSYDSEDDHAWNEWGNTLVHLACMVHDPANPEFAKEIFHQAETKFMQAAGLGNVHVYYNLACLHSLNGNYPESLSYLERAELQGTLPPLDDLLHDDWLEGLRQTAGFKQFIAKHKKY